MSNERIILDSADMTLDELIASKKSGGDDFGDDSPDPSDGGFGGGSDGNPGGGSGAGASSASAGDERLREIDEFCPSSFMPQQDDDLSI